MKVLTKRELYITYSNQRRVNLNRTISQKSHFNQVLTIEELIKKLYERGRREISQQYLDQESISIILHKLIEENSISYFDYLSLDSSSLDDLAVFFIKVKSNNRSIIDFTYHRDKHNAISTLFELYNEYLSNNNLADRADIQKLILDAIVHNHKFVTHFFDVFEKIIVDTFEVNYGGKNVDFYGSSTEKEIVITLQNKFKKIENSDKSTIQATLWEPQTQAFDMVDEVRQALKISRKLLEDGNSEDDILILTTSMNDYRSLFYMLLEEYNLKGYTLQGIPLMNYSSENYSIAYPFYRQLEENITSVVEHLKDLRITPSNIYKKKIKKNMMKSMYVPQDKVGVQLMDVNQFLEIEHNYKHIVFIGTDINHFPAQKNNTFLYTVKQGVELLSDNDLYTLAEAIYTKAKIGCDNLYIIHSLYQEERKVTPSIVITDTEFTPYDISDIKSRNELWREKKRAPIEDTSLLEYANALKTADKTVYDGLCNTTYTIEHLSASQLNNYSNCPLKYFYANIIGAKAPEDTKSELDAATKGSIMHACFEAFGKKVKEASPKPQDDELRQFMYGCSLEALQKYIDDENKKKYNAAKIEQTIYYDTFLIELQAGLIDDRQDGILARFVNYFIDNNRFDNFENSEFEKEFYLDSELKPIEMIDAKQDPYFIKGCIDRLDNLEEVTIIDYKSKKVPQSGYMNELQDKIENITDFQLGLYMLYAKQKYPNKNIIASLLSFYKKKDRYGQFTGEKWGANFANISTSGAKLIEKGQNKGNIIQTHYNDEYEAKLKEKIYETKVNIENGVFSFDNSDLENVCEYCDIKHFCHQSIKPELEKGEDNE